MWMKADEAELIPWASSMHVEWRTERDDNILDYDTIIEFLVSKLKKHVQGNKSYENWSGSG